MLKVNVAFTEEAHREHPNEYPVMTAQMRANALRSGDTFRLFCQLGSATCSNMLPILIKKIKQVPGTSLDIFVVGKNLSSDGVIKFGRDNSIPPALVRSHQITLNFGSRVFNDEISESGLKTLPLPFVTLIRNGKQIPMNVEKQR